MGRPKFRSPSALHRFSPVACGFGGFESEELEQLQKENMELRGELQRLRAQIPQADESVEGSWEILWKITFFQIALIFFLRFHFSKICPLFNFAARTFFG